MASGFYMESAPSASFADTSPVNGGGKMLFFVATLFLPPVTGGVSRRDEGGPFDAANASQSKQQNRTQQINNQGTN